MSKHNKERRRFKKHAPTEPTVKFLVPEYNTLQAKLRTLGERPAKYAGPRPRGACGAMPSLYDDVIYPWLRRQLDEADGEDWYVGDVNREMLYSRVLPGLLASGAIFALEEGPGNRTVLYTMRREGEDPERAETHNPATCIYCQAAGRVA